MKVRPHQAEAIAGFDAAVAAGHRSILLQMATGGGKTFVGMTIGRRGRLLWVAHRSELVLDQPVGAFRAIHCAKPHGGIACGRCPSCRTVNKRIGIVKASRNERHAELAVFASIQSLSRDEKLRKMRQCYFDLLVFDEAHRNFSQAKKIAKWFLDNHGDRAPIILGLTATPSRSDGRSLRELYEVICYTLPTDEAIRRGILCPYRAECIPLPDLDLGRVRVHHGDFDQAELSEEMLRAGAAEATAEIAATRCREVQSIAFTVSVDQAKRTAAAAGKAGLRAAWVCGDSPPAERARVMRDFRNGKLDFVANSMLWTEGVDFPNVSAAIIARPTNSKELYHQMIGRVLRKYPGKEEAMIFDLVGAHERHGVVCATDLPLVDVRPEESERNNHREPLEPRDDAADVAAFLEAAKVSNPLVEYSERPSEWMAIRDNLQLLILPEFGYAVVSEAEGKWLARIISGYDACRGDADETLGSKEKAKKWVETEAKDRGGLVFSPAEVERRSKEASSEHMEEVTSGSMFWLGDWPTVGAAEDLLLKRKVRLAYS